MNGILVLVLVILLAVILVLFFIVQNNRDRRELEQHLNANYRKTKDIEGDVEEDLKQD